LRNRDPGGPTDINAGSVRHIIRHGNRSDGSPKVYLGMNDLTAEHLKTPGFTDALQATLGPPYRVEREIGRGGMGVVYLARDLTLDRLVAVKVVHPDLSTNRTVAARFLTEARTIAKLRHPGIVAVHTAGEVDGQLYYVMDYLPG